tara:strand:+ start:3751 stop:3957 length:207 start_codon:yes stop_codon:yes gene_type:complete
MIQTTVTTDNLAGIIGKYMPWPQQLEEVADQLEKLNPRFNRKRFVALGTAAWEKNFPKPEDLDDEIPY